MNPAEYPKVCFKKIQTPQKCAPFTPKKRTFQSKIQFHSSCFGLNKNLLFCLMLRASKATAKKVYPNDYRSLLIHKLSYIFSLPYFFLDVGSSKKNLHIADVDYTETINYYPFFLNQSHRQKAKYTSRYKMLSYVQVNRTLRTHRRHYLH